MACNRGFNKQKYDFRDIRGICESVRHNSSWLILRTIFLVKIKIDFQTLVVVGKKIGFQAFFN